jgi:hypothetical protein
MIVQRRVRGIVVGVALAGAAVGCLPAEQENVTAGSPAAASAAPAPAAARAASPEEIVAAEREASIRAGSRLAVGDLKLLEIKVDVPIRLSGGQATLAPAPALDPIAKIIGAAQLLGRFADRALPADARGKPVEALLGLYTDKAYGTQKEGGDFTPTLVDHLVWVLRLRGVTGVPSGPPDAKLPVTPGSHDFEVIFDALNGAELMTIEEPTGK